jgi:DNA-binding response OmpR family regulator
MPAKILIVDDDPDLRGSLAAVLRSAFSVLEAAAGAEALALIKTERPRLVLLDVTMPGMDGLEVLAAAKVLDSDLIVVMLTSHHEIEIASRALNLGAAEYVTKPFAADSIRAEVLRLLSRRDSEDDRPWQVLA